MRRLGVLITGGVMLAAACSSSAAPKASPTDPAGTGPAETAQIRVVNQNLLHGTACPADTDRCNLRARVNLFVDQLVAAHCPEIVAIEEANPETVRLLRNRVTASPPCRYAVVYDDDPGQDREVVLSTLPILGSERHRLAGPLRTALWVRIASRVGPVDLVATHLASSSDDRPCDTTTCPPPCTESDSLNTCQGRQTIALLDEVRGARSVGVIAGDLNATPDEPTIAAFRAAGLVDTHLAAGNPECDPATGTNCTGGRIDDAMTDLVDARSRQSERIDAIFFDPSPRCRVGRPTGIFAPKGGPVGEAGIVFPADHSGVIATIRCRTTARDLAASKPIRTTTTTAAPAAALTPALKSAVTAAFTTLFAPNPDPDAQLATLQNAAALRDSFIARKQQVGALADQTSVRIDSFDGATSSTVDVTFSILISGNVVLDALPGQALLIDGDWLVSTQTYCQVATLGIDTIPEACRI